MPIDGKLIHFEYVVYHRILISKPMHSLASLIVHSKLPKTKAKKFGKGELKCGKCFMGKLGIGYMIVLHSLCLK